MEFRLVVVVIDGKFIDVLLASGNSRDSCDGVKIEGKFIGI